MQDEAVGGWDVRIEWRILKNNPVKCQHPSSCSLFFPLPVFLPLFLFVLPSCLIGVELECSHAKLGQIPKTTLSHTHTHTVKETERERRSEEETVDLRGQMKECWSADVFFTIALCHISNTDCLKRTIYIS